MIEASAPGSIMITGEHAVLHGARALIGAVNHRVRVRLDPRRDRRVRIRSALGLREMTLNTPDDSPPLTFVGRAISRMHTRCPSGFDLSIEADMPPDIGLGSSAAVTVAVLAALKAWVASDVEFCREGLHREALDIVRSVQGAASGADLAASIWGGILRYHVQTGIQRRHHDPFPPLTLVYAGYKTSTAEVIRQVDVRRRQAPGQMEEIFARMDRCTLSADDALASADWPGLAQALDTGQAIMELLGVCDPTLAEIVFRLRGIADIGGVKISGSGMGDCVMALGTLPAEHAFPYRLIPAQFSPDGLAVSVS